MQKLGSRIRFFTTPRELERAARELVRNRRWWLFTDIGKQAANGQYSFSPRASSSATSMIFYPSLVETQKGWTRIGCLSAGLLSLRKNSMEKDPKFSNGSFRRECSSLGALT